MYNSDGICAIDPIGYIAPCEFDIARFIGTELTDICDDDEPDFNSFLGFFSDIVNPEKLKSALFIDMAFRLHNSIFENDSFELTDKWLGILDKFQSYYK